MPGKSDGALSGQVSRVSCSLMTAAVTSRELALGSPRERSPSQRKGRTSFEKSGSGLEAALEELGRGPAMELGALYVPLLGLWLPLKVVLDVLQFDQCEEECQSRPEMFLDAQRTGIRICFSVPGFGRVCWSLPVKRGVLDVVLVQPLDACTQILMPCCVV
ncbi:hypothetical protein NQZ68_038089 [Dissostichus eleginoides]|nr:hypothetical protein NQZ68_038089 [Dissostichus eleginoides]